MNNDTRNNAPLSDAPERVKYQVRHYDMMGDPAGAWNTIRRNSLFATPADVSPELAQHIRWTIERAHPNDRGDTAQHWRELVASSVVTPHEADAAPAPIAKSAPKERK